jgi:hypothetical protein
VQSDMQETFCVIIAVWLRLISRKPQPTSILN